MKTLPILFLLLAQILLFSYGIKCLYDGRIFLGTFIVVINLIGIILNINNVLNEK